MSAMMASMIAFKSFGRARHPERDSPMEIDQEFSLTASPSEIRGACLYIDLSLINPEKNNGLLTTWDNIDKIPC